MALDLTGLKPLDTGGLDEFDTGLVTSGLTPLDTSGLKPVGAPDPLEPLRQHAQRNIDAGTTVRNDDGSTSTVRSGSVQDDRLNRGRPTLIPFVWDGQIVDADEAIRRAIESDVEWPAFDTNEAATEASKRISESIVPTAGEAPPGRLASAGSSFARGLGQTVSGLPKSIALLSAPDPEILRNLDRIDRGEPHRPQFPRAVGPGAAPVGGDPNDTLYARYQQGAPEERQRIRQEITEKFEAAIQSAPFEAGAAVDQWFTENFPTNPEFQDEFWSSKVPQALGSATGFVLSSLLTRGATSRMGPAATQVGTYAAPAALGSSLNRAQQFEDAMQSGADIATALEASELGALIGVSEAIPIGNLLNRLDRGSGGAIKRYLIRAARQGTEEAAQEAFSGILNAAVAQQLYDPERGIWTGERAEEGAVGFTTGAILETVMTLALPGRRRGRGTGAAEDVADTDREARSPLEVATFAQDRLRTLEAQETLNEREQRERDFLRETGDIGAVAAAYGVRLREPPADTGRPDLPPPTEADIESPIPTELIQEGKAILEDALSPTEEVRTDEQAESQEAEIQAPQRQEAAEARPAGPEIGRPVLDQEVTEPLDVSGLTPVSTTEPTGESRDRVGELAVAQPPAPARPEAELVDETDPLEQTRANIAGESPERASLIVLRDMIEIGTDVMNDGQFPTEIRQAASRLSTRIDAALESGEDLGPIQQEALQTVREWMKDHEFAGAEASELRAIQQVIESQTALPSPEAPGERWAVVEARPGEPFAYLDGEQKSAYLVEVTNEQGKIRYDAFTADGQRVARRPTPAFAAAAAEKVVDRQQREAELESQVAAERAVTKQTADVAIKRADVRAELEALKAESGWAEIGGRMIRKTEDVDSIDYSQVVGRTKWLPRADWWPSRPGGFNEAQTERIIDRGLAGEPLGKRQQEYFEYLVEIASDRTQLAEHMPEPEDFAEVEIENTPANATDAALVNQAIEIDEDAVEKLAIQYADDDAAFIRAIRGVIDENAAAPEGGESDQEAAPEQPAEVGSQQRTDLFGDDTRQAQALADETRRRDEARNRGQDSLETGDPTDLFSQARQQTDLIDTAPRAGATPSPSVTGQPARAPESPQERRRTEEGQRSVPEAERGAGATSGDRIEDFGQVLEGARKHVWEAYRDRLREAGEVDIAAEPLSKSWPQPDYQNLIDEGADPWAVAFVRTVRDEVPNKPQKGWRLQQWVDQTRMLRDVAGQVLDGSITRERVAEAMGRPEFKNLRKAIEDRIDLYQAVGHGKSLKGVRISAGSYSMLNGQKIDPPKVIWTVERAAKATAFSNWPTQLAQGDSREEAIANFKRDYAKIDPQPKASKQVKFDIYSYRRGPKAGRWIIGKKVGKDRVDLREFESVKEARAYMTEHHDELVKALERWKSIPAHRKESDAPRVGADHRNGADITPETFSETFGFRGVQFGNYVEGGRRQQDLNQAYDALLDLAGVLGVPARALSLNGELGLAFGARGKGGKRAPRAHYEPGTVVINLTKREGAGSLAHEWWHSLDNYFSRRRGGRLAYVSEDAQERGEGVRPEVVQAFGNLVQAINQTSLRERSRGLDRRRTKPYWATGREMSARAFESYIVAKLQDQEASNDYLANIVSEDYWKAAAALGVGEGTEEQPDYPYPTAAEIPVVRSGFDALFETIETRETEAGVEMFSLGAAELAFLDDFLNDIPRITADLEQRLKDLGLSESVQLRVVERIRMLPRSQGLSTTAKHLTDGMPALIEVALHARSPHEWVLNHEAVHVMRRLGLFREAEWRALEKAAKADEVRMERVRQRYARLNLSEDQLVEEAIADTFADWAKAEPLRRGQADQPKGFLRAALEKILNFLRALRAALTSHGYTTTEDVFQAMERGEVGRRPSAEPSTDARARFSLRAGDFDPGRAAAAVKKQRATAPPAHDVHSNRFLDEAIFRFQDKFNYLAKAQKAAARERDLSEVPEAEDAYLAELRYHGMAGAAVEDFQREHVEPLVDAISKSGLTVDDIDRYLHARHAPEANAQLQRINPDRENNEALSGLSDAEAATVIDGFRETGQLAALERIAARVDAITKAQRDLLVEAGLESADTITKWEETYQHYVPLHREGFDGRPPARGKGFSVTGRQKRRAGSQRAVAQILAQVVAQHEATIIRAQKNRVAQALHEFAKNNPNADLYEVDKVEFQPSFGTDGLVTFRPARGFQFADNVVVVKVEGQDHTVTFNEQNHQARRIAHSMKNLGADHSGPILNTLMGVTRFLALVNTGANPEFIISNFARDIQTAGYNLSSTEADKLKWTIIKDVGKAWRGIRAFQKQKAHPWAPHFDAFRKAGAKTGWMDFYGDIAQREQRLVKMIEEISSTSAPLKIKRGLRSLFEFIEEENTAVENAIRLSAFVHARRDGLSDGQAARLAKELTVNFNRKGDYGQVMNALYLFYNASIQGSARVIQAAARSKKVRLLIGATVIAAMFLDMLNRALAGDDEDDKNRYDKIPGHVKERNLIIMRPEGSGDYIKIPLPWGYNVFHVMGQVMGEALTKRNFKPTEGGARMASAVLNAFNPIGGEGSIAQTISPTIADPIVQWAENKDWAGRPLRPEGNPFDVEKPQSQQYWNSVREPSRWIAEQLNELTGGNEVRPGAIDINPEAIDLFIDTYTGGAGRFVSDTLSTPVKAIQGEDIEAYEIPLLRKVYGRPGMGTLFQEYYSNADAVRITEKEARHYVEIDDRRALGELRRERHGEYSLIKARRKIESELTRLRKLRNQAEAARVSESAKRARIDEIEKRMEQLMNRFNRLYNERVGE